VPRSSPLLATEFAPLARLKENKAFHSFLAKLIFGTCHVALFLALKRFRFPAQKGLSVYIVPCIGTYFFYSTSEYCPITAVPERCLPRVPFCLFEVSQKKLVFFFKSNV
jgi:hypothetical protein